MCVFSAVSTNLQRYFLLQAPAAYLVKGSRGMAMERTLDLI